MAGQASVFTNRKGALYWLMAMTFVFQILSHLKMWSVLSSEEEERNADTDAWCPAVMNATAPTSARCAEARLFKAWKQAAAMATPRGAEVADMTSTEAPIPKEDSELRAVLGLGAASSSETTPTPAPAVAAWSPMTAWAEGLAELQRGLERRFNALPSASRRRAEEFDRHAGRIAISLESSQLTHWGEDLQVLQQRLEEKQAALRGKRRAAAPAGGATPTPTMAPPSPADGSASADAHANVAAATFKEEAPLMDKINAVHKELCKDPRRRDRADCKEFLAGLAAAREAARDARRLATGSAKVEAELRQDMARIASERDAWQRDFEAELRGAYRELCAERGGAWCTAPEAASTTNRSEEHAALRADIARETKEQTAALDAKLAKLAADRKDWERELLEHYGLASHEPVVVAAATGASPRAPQPSRSARRSSLRWSEVRAWAEARRLRGGRGGAHEEITRADLEGAQWAAEPPSVVCVTAVPLGHRAKSQVKYVVDNFLKQTYRAAQLVLVYHHEDAQAAEIVKEYSQGDRISGVAARGSHEDFPSAADIRFGAWSATGAQAIAEWDFDAHQHPRRLEWQMEALALTERPASLLRALPTPEQELSGGQPELTEGSLLGEISWMREHWRPSTKEQRSELEGEQSANVVVVAMDSQRPHTTAAAERLRTIRAEMDRHVERLAAVLQGGASGAEAPTATA